MPRTQTIQVVIEVELTEHEQIIPHPPHPVVARRPAPAEQLVNEEHEQALLDVLRADLTRYAEFIHLLLVEALEGYEVKRRKKLAQLLDTHMAEYTLLQDLVPRLPPAAQAYFHRALQEQRFADTVESVFNAVEISPLRIRVDYQIPPTEQP